MAVAPRRAALLAAAALSRPRAGGLPAARAYSAPSGGGPVRWGLLSAGRIADDYARALAASAPEAVASAVAARDPSKAAAFAERHNIPTIHASYEELLDDPDVDVVYVATIADAHAEWAERSLLAGKPTVVEKPITLCHSDTRRLVDLARERNVFLMEGMWTRCFPAYDKLRELVANRAVGEIVYAQGDFGWAFPHDAPDDRVWWSNSGGITLDVGMYVAQLGRVAFPHAALEDVRAVGNAKNGVDYTVMATVTYDRSRGEEDGGASDLGNGLVQLTLTGAANTEERIVLQGTKGRIVLDGPAHVPQRLRVSYDRGRTGGDAAADEDVFDFPLPDDPYGKDKGPCFYPGSLGFVHQIAAVGQAVREGRTECPAYTWEDALEVARIVDGIVGQVRGEDGESDSS